MGRSIKDARLQDRTFRGRLPPRHHPYWRSISQGFHLGYYRGKRVGTWVVRYRKPGSSKDYVMESLGEADDIVGADGHNILSWAQALDKALAWVKQQRNADPVADAKVTVAQAIELYTGFRDDRESKRAGRSIRSDASSRLTLHVLSDPYLPQLKMADLTERDLRNWQRRLEDLRSTTKRRLINDLKAALNAAYVDNRLALPSDLETTIKIGLKPVFNEDPTEPIARVNQVLTDDEIRKIVRKSAELDADGDFARLVLVLAATGARFSQVRRILVQDVQAEHGRLLLPRSHKGRGKSGDHIRVPVGADVIEQLLPVTEDRDPYAPLLEHWRLRQIGPLKWEKIGRGPWNAASEMTRKWKQVVDAVGLPDTIPYALRHSSIVRGLTHDLPIRLVAALHDTSVAMIERHYSRWITDQLDDLASTAVVSLS